MFVVILQEGGGVCGRWAVASEHEQGEGVLWLVPPAAGRRYALILSCGFRVSLSASSDALRVLLNENVLQTRPPISGFW